MDVLALIGVLGGICNYIKFTQKVKEQEDTQINYHGEWMLGRDACAIAKRTASMCATQVDPEKYQRFTQYGRLIQKRILWIGPSLSSLESNRKFIKNLLDWKESFPNWAKGSVTNFILGMIPSVDFDPKNHYKYTITE